MLIARKRSYTSVLIVSVRANLLEFARLVGGKFIFVKNITLSHAPIILSKYM